MKKIMFNDKYGLTEAVLVCNEKVSFPLLNGWVCKSNNKKGIGAIPHPHTPKDAGIFAQ